MSATPGASSSKRPPRSTNKGMDDMEVDAPAPKPGNEEFSPELLRFFYARLFPYSQMFKWLSYGNDPDSDQPHVVKDFFSRREFSFTINDDIYIRYQSFRDKAEMEAAIQKKQPHKIDIGAVFTFPPRDHHTIKAEAFKPVERELIFDIDMTDYDDIRNCCEGAKICPKCWVFMTMAVKVVDTALRGGKYVSFSRLNAAWILSTFQDDFGFKHIMWVYSGRRGVHCWVCDDHARALNNDGRSAVVEYLSLAKGNENAAKKSTLTWPLHPSFIRAYDILEPMFEAQVIGQNGQGLLDSENMWDDLLDTLPDEDLANKLKRDMRRLTTAKARWQEIKSAVQSKLSGRSSAASAAIAKRFKGGGNNRSIYALDLWKYETVFKYCYPRLDVNVSKGINHLLKSPFAVHPKTGRVCVPIDPLECDSFDPFRVPTLRVLVQQIDKYDEEHGQEDAKATPDYKKTELRKSIELFERVLIDPMALVLKRRLRMERERSAAMMGDF